MEQKKHVQWVCPLLELPLKKKTTLSLQDGYPEPIIPIYEPPLIPHRKQLTIIN